MSIGSILASLTGTSAHAAFSTQSSGSTAASELHSLFAKLHMDAIASAGTTTAAGTTSATSTSTTSTGGVTDLVHSLRHILDGGISVAKEARSAAKAATAYAHGGGLGALATQVINKVA